jgi:hypothetical protein
LAIFSFVRRYIRERDNAPTIREIEAAGLGFTRRSLLYNINALEHLDYFRTRKEGRTIRIEPSGPRARKEKHLWRLVDDGVANWSGGKPRGSDPPIEVTPGPPISDYIIENRH